MEPGANPAPPTINDPERIRTFDLLDRNQML